jgi:hypothetical protein
MLDMFRRERKFKKKNETNTNIYEFYSRKRFLLMHQKYLSNAVMFSGVISLKINDET